MDGLVFGKGDVHISPSLNTFVISAKYSCSMTVSSSSSTIGLSSQQCLHEESARFRVSSLLFGSFPVVNSNRTTPKLYTSMGILLSLYCNFCYVSKLTTLYIIIFLSSVKFLNKLLILFILIQSVVVSQKITIAMSRALAPFWRQFKVKGKPSPLKDQGLRYFTPGKEIHATKLYQGLRRMVFSLCILFLNLCSYALLGNSPKHSSRGSHDQVSCHYKLQNTDPCLISR